MFLQFKKASEVSVKQQTIVTRKKSDIGTPSILDALNGIVEEEKPLQVAVPENYARVTNVIDKDFSPEQLQDAWSEYAKIY